MDGEESASQVSSDVTLPAFDRIDFHAVDSAGRGFKIQTELSQKIQALYLIVVAVYRLAPLNQKNI